jgi:hypothetical protein
MSEVGSGITIDSYDVDDEGKKQRKDVRFYWKTDDVVELLTLFRTWPAGYRRSINQ